MKKLLISLLLLGSVFANTFAQAYDVVEAGEDYNDKANEVYFSVGTTSTLPIALTVVTFGLITMGEGESIPVTFMGGYNHFFSDDHFGVGGFVTYERAFGCNIVTAQAEITGQYGWEHVKFFHSLSLGVGVLTNGSDPGFFPAFDLTLLGVKFNFTNFNIFVDFSLPTTSILKIGASYKF